MQALNSNVFAGLTAEEKSIFGNTVLVTDFNDLFMAESKYKERLQSQDLTTEERERYNNLLKTVRKIQDRRIELTANFLGIPKIIVPASVENAVNKAVSTEAQTTTETKAKESVGGKIIKAVFGDKLSKEEKKVAQAVQTQLFEDTETAQQKVEPASVKTPEIEFDRFPVLTNDGLMQLFELFVIRDGKLYHEDKEITSLSQLESVLIGYKSENCPINTLRNFYLDLLQHDSLRFTDLSSKLKENVISSACRFENLVVKYKEKAKPVQKTKKEQKQRLTLTAAKEVILNTIKEKGLEEGTKVANQILRKDCVIDEATKHVIPPYGSQTIDKLIADWTKTENVEIQPEPAKSYKLVVSQDQIDAVPVERLIKCFTDYPSMNNMVAVLGLLKHWANCEKDRSNETILFAQKVLPGKSYISKDGNKVIISDQEVELILKEIRTNSAYPNSPAFQELCDKVDINKPFFETEEKVTSLVNNIAADIALKLKSSKDTIASLFQKYINENIEGISFISKAAIFKRVKAKVEEINNPVVVDAQTDINPVEKGLLFVRASVKEGNKELWEDASKRVNSFDTLVTECKAIVDAHNWVEAKNFALDAIAEGLVPEAKEFTEQMTEDWYDKFITNLAAEQKSEPVAAETSPETSEKEAVIAAAEEQAYTETNAVINTATPDVIKDIKLVEKLVKDAVSAGNNIRATILDTIVRKYKGFKKDKNGKQSLNWLNNFAIANNLQLA